MMEDLTKTEMIEIAKNTCPDCGAENEFLSGPKAGGSQNILCAKCKMRFNIGFGSGERLGKEIFVGPDFVDIPEGTLSWSKQNNFEYLTHSCNGSVDLHVIDNETAVLVCRKCYMRLLFPSQDIKNLDIHAYKTKELFTYLSTERPWERATCLAAGESNAYNLSVR